MSNCIVFEDGNLINDINSPVLWDGLFSKALKNGSIVNYIQTCLPKNSICVIPKSDGNIKRIQNKNEYNNGLLWDEIQKYINYSKSKNKVFLLCVLCQNSEEEDINYVYLPLDDNFFEYGVEHFFNKDNLLKWESRSSELAWIGGCSGVGGNESLRVRFVKKIYEYDPFSKVRLSYWWRETTNIEEKYFSGRVDFSEFLKYKIFFIVDGNVIASNHMWGFATGCVPFLISRGKCWFSSFIIPYVHYIPINYDLSNLIEQIEFVKNNDDKAKQIAENSLEFVKTYFSSDFQKEYLKKSINKFFEIL
jgi:hypothetical protein